MKELRWKEQQSLELSALASEQELSALKSQINPHFLFNTLNSINAMVSRDAEETRRMIAQLGDLLRYVVDTSKIDFVFFNEELEFTKSYLALESKRLSDRLKIVYNIAPEVLSRKIPPLIIQPLVENAIKHGIEPSENGGTVFLQASIDNNKLMILVRDTGVSIKDKMKRDERNGVGLKNITARLRLLYSKEANLITNIVTDDGFEAKLSLPLRKL
jgi:LytS/YehU family sensor histidine kinase